MSARGLTNFSCARATNGAHRDRARSAPPRKSSSSDEDIRNVVLDLQPGVTVSGHLVFRGLRHRQLRRWRAQVWRSGWIRRPLPVDPLAWSIDRARRRDRAVVLHDVFPGEYRISASQRESTGWFWIRRRSPAWT